MTTGRLNALRQLAFVVPALLALTLPLTGLAGSDAETTEDGLQLVEENRHRSLYVAPDVDWSRYSAIQLEDPTVEFRRNWQRDQNRSWPFKVRDEDVVEIKQSLAELLIEVFGEELSRDGGYALSDESGSQVLILRPAITELDVAAPDTQNWAGISYQYTESSGRMTLQLELIDSVSGKVLSRFKERDEVPRMYYYQRTNRVTNEADARRMLRRWAEEQRERLDEARSESMAMHAADKSAASAD
ncbi:MAG TPA: DUF3313 family protein [Xanthomonadales bacterium]|nr:DUF3313 family protein [Xanthomonadales bacterium]